MVAHEVSGHLRTNTWQRHNRQVSDVDIARTKYLPRRGVVFQALVDHITQQATSREMLLREQGFAGKTLDVPLHLSSRFVWDFGQELEHPAKEEVGFRTIRFQKSNIFIDGFFSNGEV